MSQQDFLFSDQTCVSLSLLHADVRYYPNFIPNHTEYFALLKKQIPWQQDELPMYGKPVLIPRLNAWFGDDEANYGYSGIRLKRNAWFAELLDLRNQIQQTFDYSFNSVLANLYRDGNDSVGWHSDDEKELGRQPVIASLSFGDTRRFSLRPKKLANHKPVHIDLQAGSLLLMAGDTQHYWLHQLAKTKQQGLRGRINLTFRNIVS